MDCVDKRRGRAGKRVSASEDWRVQRESLAFIRRPERIRTKMIEALTDVIGSFPNAAAKFALKFVQRFPLRRSHSFDAKLTQPHTTCLDVVRARRGKKAVSRSAKAGLQFPVGRIAPLPQERQVRHPRRCRCPRVPRRRPRVPRRRDPRARRQRRPATTRSPASCPATSSSPIRNDEELNKLLGGVTIASGGVLPNIHSVLLPKRVQEGLSYSLKNPFLNGALKRNNASHHARKHSMVINNHHHINEKQLHPRRRRRASRGENKLIQTRNRTRARRTVLVRFVSL